MRGMNIVNHQVKSGITPEDLVCQHQDQVGATTHFIDAHLRSIEYRTHADGAHELRRVFNAIRLQHDMCDANVGTLVVHSQDFAFFEGFDLAELLRATA